MGKASLFIYDFRPNRQDPAAWERVAHEHGWDCERPSGRTVEPRPVSAADLALVHKGEPDHWLVGKRCRSMSPGALVASYSFGALHPYARLDARVTAVECSGPTITGQLDSILRAWPERPTLTWLLDMLAPRRPTALKTLDKMLGELWVGVSDWTADEACARIGQVRDAAAASWPGVFDGAFEAAMDLAQRQATLRLVALMAQLRGIAPECVAADALAPLVGSSLLDRACEQIGVVCLDAGAGPANGAQISVPVLAELREARQQASQRLVAPGGGTLDEFRPAQRILAGLSDSLDVLSSPASDEALTNAARRVLDNLNQAADMYRRSRRAVEALAAAR